MLFLRKSASLAGCTHSLLRFTVAQCRYLNDIGRWHLLFDYLDYMYSYRIRIEVNNTNDLRNRITAYFSLILLDSLPICLEELADRCLLYRSSITTNTNELRDDNSPKPKRFSVSQCQSSNTNCRIVVYV